MPIKIAHRGYCINYHSNTLNSIKDAINNNFDMIEIDIQLDKNNNIIVYHDIHYKDKLIENYSYNELKKEIPDLLLLSHLFKNINYKDVKIYLDLKGSDKLSYELHSLFTKMNIDTTNIWLASFNLNHIDILNKMDRYNLGLISENNYTLDMLTYLTSKYNFSFIAFAWTVLNEQTIQFLKSRNIKIFTYTINQLYQINFIKHYGVDGIITDILI
jgi:glycerophosphoryl diester phosphodiesterase